MSETELTMTARRDSGVPWIGSIPGHWEMVRAKYLFDLHKDIVGPRHEDFNRLSLTMHGVLPRDKAAADGLQPSDFAGYQIVQSGDLIFKLIDLANVATSRVGLAEESGLVSPVYICLSPSQKVHDRFYYWFFMSMYFRQIFNTLGSGVRSALNAKDLLNLSVPLPPLDEQQRIAAYLDQETAKIDALIAEYKVFLEILKRRDQALIAECVTKGVPARRAGRKMKDSGVEWIGQIPEEWRVAELKRFSLFNPSKSEAKDLPDDLKVSFVGMADVTAPGQFTSNEGSKGDLYSGYTYFKNNDIVFAKVSPCFQNLNTFVASSLSNEIGFGSTEFNVIRATEKSQSRWLFYLSMFDPFIAYCSASMTGVGGLQRIPNETVERFPFPLPSVSEQGEIATHLDISLAKSKSLIAEVTADINRLGIYRKSVIGHAMRFNREQ